MKNYWLTTSFLIFLSASAFSQKHDYYWLTGYASNLDNIQYGGSVIDFNIVPPDIYYEYREMNLQRTNASICDTSGNLLFYTNGIYIANSINEQMENGGGLNPGQYTSDFSHSGLSLVQGAIIIPSPNNLSLYYVFHEAVDWSNEVSPNTYVNRLYYSKVNMDYNGGIGAVESKNQQLLFDTLDYGKLTAVKSGNGIDWWLILQKYDTNIYYRLLLTPDGITMKNPIIVGELVKSGAGQAVFSPDGTKYINYQLIAFNLGGHQLNIYDFDRCEGLLSNHRQVIIPDSAWTGGVAVSPNSRFLYVSSYRYIYQFDLWAEDIASTKDTVAIYDGFAAPFPTRFYLAQLAPDGKIYLNCTSSVSYLHVINNPNLPGDSCDVCQHCIELPTRNSFSLPNFPNYRLHYLEGSLCDTLRQQPVAEWVHEPLGMEVAFEDASFHDIRTWHWSFGDGATDTVPNPVHSYAAEGVYNVCLSVSNPRGADTLCREVQVLVSSTAGFDSAQPAAAVRVEIWPNPVQSNAPVTLVAEGLPAAKVAGTVQDALGRTVLRFTAPVLNGRIRQELDVSGLAAGVYFVELTAADGASLWSSKILKL